MAFSMFININLVCFDLSKENENNDIIIVLWFFVYVDMLQRSF